MNSTEIWSLGLRRIPGYQTFSQVLCCVLLTWKLNFIGRYCPCFRVGQTTPVQRVKPKLRMDTSMNMKKVPSCPADCPFYFSLMLALPVLLTAGKFSAMTVVPMGLRCPRAQEDGILLNTWGRPPFCKSVLLTILIWDFSNNLNDGDVGLCLLSLTNKLGHLKTFQKYTKGPWPPPPHFFV